MLTKKRPDTAARAFQYIATAYPIPYRDAYLNIPNELAQ
jgi:hypothetical protein